MLPLGLFRIRNFWVANLTTLTAYAGLIGGLFFVGLFLQQVAGYSPLEAGLATTPISILMFFLSPRFGRIASGTGPRLPMTRRARSSAASGCCCCCGSAPTPNYLADVLPGLLVFGVGLSATVAPLTATVLDSVDEHHVGIASGRQQRRLPGRRAAGDRRPRRRHLRQLRRQARRPARRRRRSPRRRPARSPKPRKSRSAVPETDGLPAAEGEPGDARPPPTPRPPSFHLGIGIAGDPDDPRRHRRRPRDREPAAPGRSGADPAAPRRPASAATAADCDEPTRRAGSRALRRSRRGARARASHRLAAACRSRSSSPASSRPAASTSATTSARSASTSRGRTAATRRSTASSTCTRSRSPTTRPNCASALYDTTAILLAAGLDPERCILFRQSDVREHTELTWLLSAVTAHGDLNRMHQFKEKSAKQRELVSAALFFYPVLMAADVLAYRATEVPVGDDQRQHVELMREIARRFNERFGETLVVPELPDPRGRRADHGPAGARAEDVDDRRHRGRAPSTCSTSPTRSARSSAAPSPTRAARSSAAPDKPGITNLIDILAVARGSDPAEVESEFEGSGYGDFKKAVAEAVVEYLAPGARALRRAAPRRGGAGARPRRRAPRRRARSPLRYARRRARARWASARS